MSMSCILWKNSTISMIPGNRPDDSDSVSAPPASLFPVSVYRCIAVMRNRRLTKYNIFSRAGMSIKIVLTFKQFLTGACLKNAMEFKNSVTVYALTKFFSHKPRNCCRKNICISSASRCEQPKIVPARIFGWLYWLRKRRPMNKGNCEAAESTVGAAL